MSGMASMARNMRTLNIILKLKLNMTTDWMFFGVRIPIVHGQSPEHCKAEQEGPNSSCNRS